MFSSVADGDGAAVSGEGEKSPEETDAVCGHAASVESHRTTGGCVIKHTRQLRDLHDSHRCIDRSSVVGFRSWRTVWFSLWPDASSLPTVSAASGGFNSEVTKM